MIVAPYAVHDASVADFAPGHSLAQTLAEADVGSVALTFWKSASAEIRDYGRWASSWCAKSACLGVGKTVYMSD